MKEFEHMVEAGGASVDDAVINDAWSVLSDTEAAPEIDFARLYDYRTARLKAEMRKADVALLVMINPSSLRYAADYDSYQLFQAHMPATYMFLPLEGPAVMFGSNAGLSDRGIENRPARPLTFFDSGTEQSEASRLFAADAVRFLEEIGSDSRRIAVEFVNPSQTQALMQRGLKVLDGIPIAEAARVIKSEDEVACVRWAVAVAEHGIRKMKKVLRPGVSELQLWGLLNYTNLANHGGWHDGRMLASGPRTNPWLQEATQRKFESGDLVAFDTDMVGPMGYFADISRTLHCGPDKPTKRQKQLYQLAHEEVHTNMSLVQPGISFFEIQDQASDVPEEFREQAYPCVMHAVGMCDEYPRINYGFRGRNFYDGVLQAGMVMCIESYMGAVGETHGVKLEQQVLVTEDGYDMLTNCPFEESLLD